MLNLCLGLKNKRLEIENLMSDNDIKIKCLQEVDVKSNYDPNIQHRQTVTIHLHIYWGTTRLSLIRSTELEPSIYLKK